MANLFNCGTIVYVLNCTVPLVDYDFLFRPIVVHPEVYKNLMIVWQTAVYARYHFLS
jgi:hypothetical protein